MICEQSIHLKKKSDSTFYILLGRVIMVSWDFFDLGEINWVSSQSIWHAAALSRSRGYQERDMLFIDWPDRPFVCCGMHQVIDIEIDLEYCKMNGIPFVRRACGGGQVYLDGNQIFYQPVFLTDNDIIPSRIEKMFQKLLEPVVATYQDFGIEAEYKPVNDIIVNNRKISGNGAGTFEKSSFVVGNFILSFPREEMARVLIVPDEKFRDKVLKGLQNGITSFVDEIGIIPPREDVIKRFKSNFEEIIGVNLNDKGIIHQETWKLVDHFNKYYFEDEWRYYVENRGSGILTKGIKIMQGTHIVHSLHKAPGGLIRAIMEVNTDEKIIKNCVISGDFTITPHGSIKKIENSLEGIFINSEAIHSAIERVITNERIQIPGIIVDDFVKVIFKGVESIKTG